MNKLGYRCTKDNGLSFELLVDGQPLGALLGVTDEGIPFWILDTGLPLLSPNPAETDIEMKIVAVCSCGEYGCGHTRCRVIRDGEVVMFCDFDLTVDAEGRDKVFEFTRSNYEEVVSEIFRLASREKSQRLQANPQ